MKKFYLKTLLLAGLAALPLLANATEWRQQGYEVYYRQPGERQWHRAPGSARAVSDGWVIGTDRVYGGYGIYRWNGNNWDRAPGAAVQIGGSYERPWVVNDRGERFSWNGYDWRAEGYAGRVVQRERNDRNDRYEGRVVIRERDERRREDWRDRDRGYDNDRRDGRDYNDNRRDGDWRR